MSSETRDALAFGAFVIGGMLLLLIAADTVLTKVADRPPLTVETSPISVDEAAALQATELVIISADGCAPCRRLKVLTVPVLLAEGYRVSIVDADQWPEPIRLVPTLIYRNAKHIEVYREVGFRTPAQIKEILRK